MDSSKNIISLTGFMGAGKSTVGRELACRLGWTFVDLDAEIEAAAGLGIPDFFRKFGEAAFRALEIRTLKQVLKSRKAPFVLALGGGTICSDEARESIFDSTFCIFLDASEDEIVRRVGPDTSSRPVFDIAMMQKRLPFYRQAHYEISTDGKSVLQIVDEILEREVV